MVKLKNKSRAKLYIYMSQCQCMWKPKVDFECVSPILSTLCVKTGCFLTQPCANQQGKSG